MQHILEVQVCLFKLDCDDIKIFTAFLHYLSQTPVKEMKRQVTLLISNLEPCKDKDDDNKDFDIIRDLLSIKYLQVLRVQGKAVFVLTHFRAHGDTLIGQCVVKSSKF